MVARRCGGVWRVGGITGADARVLTVRLADFLGDAGEAATTYRLEMQRDPHFQETVTGIRDIIDKLESSSRAGD